MDDLRVLAAVVGFVLLGLSPSFVDWQENPDRRAEIVVYYVVAVVLIWIGVLR